MIKLKQKDIVVEVDTDVLEIISMRKNGVEFLYQKENNWQKDFPILFPICGKLRDDKFTFNNVEYSLKRHGFFREIKNWKLIENTDSKVSFEYISGKEFIEIYPWEFKITFTVEIKDNNVLISNEVKNLSNETMFYSLGYHPAFEVEKEGKISFSTKQKLFKDSDNLNYLIRNPKEGIEIDNTKIKDIDFTNSQFYWTDKNIANSFKYIDNKKELEIDLNPFIDNSFLLWSESNEADYVCFEPMNGSADFSDRDNFEISKKDQIISLKTNETKIHKLNLKLTVK